MTPFLVGVAGGSGSGKSTFCRMLRDASPKGAVVVIEHDFYYHCLAHQPAEQRVHRNFDHPDALETGLLIEQLRKLKSGEAVEAPQYDYTTHTRSPTTRRIEPHPVVLIDGILVLAEARLWEMFDLKVFVDAPDELRYQRRLARDGVERGRSADQVLAHYLASVKPMHDEFVAPSRGSADVIVPGGAHFGPAVELFAAMVRDRATI